MSDRRTANDFRGETTIPLPLQGHLKHGWFRQGHASFKGDWEILMATDKGEWPNALIDRDDEKYIIFTYPRGRHEVTEVDIGHDPDLGIFMVVDLRKNAAFDWFPTDRYDKRTPEEFAPSDDFDGASQTPILISKYPHAQYGRAIIFWRPSTQYLDKVVDLAPFSSGSPRLMDAADKVMNALGLSRGKPKRQCSKAGDTSDVDRERVEELRNKFEDIFRDDES